MKNTQNHKDLNILVIEDTPIILHLHQKMLETMGYKPDCAQTGEEALKLLQANKYDLVLTDIDLPDMDGIMITERLRFIEGLRGEKKAYVVAITAFIRDEIKKQCANSEINKIISKPLRKEALEEFLHTAHSLKENETCSVS